MLTYAGKMKMRRAIQICVAVLCAAVGILAAVNLAIYPFQYTTTDIADYYDIKGNVNNKTPKDRIFSFFPDQIWNDFSDVVYAYRAERGDTFGFEAYLEFTIEDPEKYREYVSGISEGLEPEVFPYDADYQVYVIESDFWTREAADSEDGDVNLDIREADVRMILFNEKEQRIIYSAIGVYEGTNANTGFLCVFLERFGIKPQEFVQWLNAEKNLQ